MNTHQTKQVVLALILIANGALDAAARKPDDASPTPTPCPKRLGDIKLKNVARSDDNGHVVISDADLADLAGRGSLTVGGKAATETTRSKPRKTPSRSVRERWRTKVLNRKGVIDGLERKHLRIEAQIDLIEDAKVTARSLAQLQKAEIELRSIEREIRAEKAELGRLIREARRDGAEPGWFR